jgi:hypothetical protein
MTATMTERQLRATAYHEAGHAVAHFLRERHLRLVVDDAIRTCSRLPRSEQFDIESHSLGVEGGGEPIC